MKKKYKIFVVGLGSLGLNYMRAIAKLSLKAQVFYFDKNKSALNQKFSNSKNIDYFKVKNIINFNKKIDLVIIATTAKGRLKLIETLLKNKCKYWILEKMIEQNISATNKIKKILSKYKCWVDIPRRGMKEYKLIKNEISKKNYSNIDLKIKIFGDRIITSSVHLIDLLCWIMDTSIKKIDVSTLNKKWTKSKRKGFYDIGGKLQIILKNNSKVVIQTSKNKNSGAIFIGNKFINFEIDENKGLIICSNSKNLRISPPHVSLIMPKIIENILKNGESYLPTINDVVKDHNILIKSLKLYWEKTHGKKTKYLPVT